MHWLCARLEHPELDRLARREGDTGPLVIGERRGGREVVRDADRGARDRGIRPGQAVSAALALAPGLTVRPRDPGAQARLLERLAAWARQFTDRVCPAGEDSLLLEVGGSESLFGGLAPLVAAVGEGLEALGYRHLLATAPTPTASEWLARAGCARECPDLGSLPEALAGLPAAVALADPADCERLHGMGLTRVGDLLALPRAELARRFGPALGERLDRALGARPDPRHGIEPPPGYSGELELPAETADAEALGFAVRRLLDELAGVLRAGCRRAGAIELALSHRGRPPTRLRVGFAQPAGRATAMFAIVRERLAATALEAPVTAVTLTAEALEPAAGRTGALLEETASTAPAAELLDRLRARLGADAVHGLVPVAEHRPEHACRAVEPGAAAGPWRTAARPLWLLDRPRPLAAPDGRPCGEDGTVLMLLGPPERLESGWWDGGDIARDYYPARDGSGAALWVFRDRRGEWYLHGVFG